MDDGDRTRVGDGADAPPPPSATVLERENVRFAIHSLLVLHREQGAEHAREDYHRWFPGYEDLVDDVRDALDAAPPADPLGATRIAGDAAAAKAPPATPSDRESTADAPTLGPYRIVRELGRGGMGVVYEARDTRLPRRVALKVLSPQFAHSATLRLRFEREAALASKLDHPRICTVYEAGTADGAPYLAMRFVEGDPLADLIAASRASAERSAVVSLPEPDRARGPTETAERTRELDRVLLLFERTARALHAAHEAGLIHRDIKPHNVMVTETGEPVLLDFGLAREEAGEGHQLTQTGSLMGTPAYMSPEQLMAGRVVLDRRTDVYSLGVALYESLALRLPFEAPTVDGLYRKIQSTEPPGLRKVNTTLPRDLAVVVATAMEKDRDRRYQTAEELADELARVRRSEAILARPPGVTRRTWLWARRNRVAAVAGVLLTAALVFSLASMADATASQRAMEGVLERMRDEERLKTIALHDTMTDTESREVRAILRKVIRDPRLEESVRYVAVSPAGEDLARILARPDRESLLGVAANAVGIERWRPRVVVTRGDGVEVFTRPYVPGGTWMVPVGFAFDGRTVLVSDDGSVLAFDREGTEVARCGGGALVDVSRTTDRVLVRTAGGILVRTTRLEPVAGFEEPIVGDARVVFGDDGRRIVVGGPTELVILGGGGTRERVVRRPQGPQGDAVGSVQPGAPRVVLATDPGGGVVRCFDSGALMLVDVERAAFETEPGKWTVIEDLEQPSMHGRLRGTSDGYSPPVVAAAPSQGLVAAARAGRVEVRGLDGGVRSSFAIERSSGNRDWSGVQALDVHPSRPVVLLVSGGAADVLAFDGERHARLRALEAVIDARFVPGTDTVVGVTVNGAVCLWDLYWDAAPR